MPKFAAKAVWLCSTLCLAAVTGTIAACSSPSLTDTASGGGSSSGGPTQGGGRTECHAGVQGCACDTSGAIADCGHVTYTSGDYVTCSEGQSVCDGSVWGPCVGNNIVTKSLSPKTIGPGGLRALSTTSACSDPCDPNGCTQTTGGPSDVDATTPGLAVTEAGVTLTPTISTSGGVDGGTGDGATCRELQCQVNYCGGSTNGTTITGKVFDPAGVNPLYNAWVYIPVSATAPLPSFTQGVTCDTCAGAGNFSAVAVAQTAADGSFTLTHVPDGTNIPIVVQMGKWRRKITLSSVSSCSNNAISNGTLRLPKNRTDGDGSTADIPQIAFVSGSADPFECMLLKSGIDPNEFGSLTLNSNRRIHYYDSPDSAGNSIDSSFGNVVTGSTLWNSSSNLNLYDVVILACEGAEYTSDRSASGYTDLVNYAGAGGRVFLSHYSYVWLKYNSPWQAVVHSWGPKSTVATQDPLSATVVTSGFPKGQAFSQWLYDIGDGTDAGVLNISQARQDQTSPLASTVQSWMTATNTSTINLSGSFAVTNGSTSVTGNFSSLNSQLAVGMKVTFSSQSGTSYTVASIGSNSSMTLTSAYTGTSSSFASAVAAMNPATYSPSFTFNTPLTASSANQCGRVVFSDFHVATTALVSNFGGVASCTTDANCGYGSTCGALGTCSQGTCTPSTVTSDCGDSHFSCTGATVGKCGCKTNSDCSAMSAGTCSGATAGSCGTATCYQNSDCSSGTQTCSGGSVGRCVMNGTCSKKQDCGGRSCVGGVCSSPPSCTSATDCGSKETCSGATKGKCGCYQGSECSAMGAGSTCSGGTTGSCTTATCYSNSTCTAGTQVCSGGQRGACTPNSCTSNSNCSTLSSGSEKCSGGTCSGCYTSSDCPGSGATCVGGTAVGKCTGNANNFPYACAKGTLTPQEAALEFELFDLSSCVSPDTAPPPAPPVTLVTYNSVTITEDFVSSCPSGTRVVWRELDWQASIPATASIAFSAQTVDPSADGGAPNYTGAQAVPVYTATTTTTAPWDTALLDVSGDAGTGVFNTAHPTVVSKGDLRITITLNPTSDQMASPTLTAWQVKSDCVASE